MSEPASESKETTSLEIVHPNAAGIDIGNAAHYVSVPPDRDPQPVRDVLALLRDDLELRLRDPDLLGARPELRPTGERLEAVALLIEVAEAEARGLDLKRAHARQERIVGEPVRARRGRRGDDEQQRERPPSDH